MGVYEARLACLEREHERCALCGGTLYGSYGYSLHHRQPRGMGGSRHNPRINLPSNFLVVCGSGTTGCHGSIESNRTWAYHNGWLVRRPADPANVPIYGYQGRSISVPVWLDEVGHLHETPTRSHQ